jgi:predicted ABC-type ATPase
MIAATEKRILIIAGPNGAGKTTFAEEFLPNEANCPAFVNADLIAAGLSPFQPDAAAFAAGRLMLREIERHVRAGKSFAFETTLSGRHYATRIPRWQVAGYRVKLFFLRLASPELAIARVRQRVQAGGHDIPESVIQRRFQAGWLNFSDLYKQIVDEWALYDNSGPTPQLLEEGVNP